MVRLMNEKDELQAEHQEACIALAQVTGERDQLLEQLQITRTQCEGLEAMATHTAPPAELRERARACDRLQRALSEATRSKTQALEELLNFTSAEGGGDPSAHTAASARLEEASALEEKLRVQLEGEMRAIERDSQGSQITEAIEDKRREMSVLEGELDVTLGRLEAGTFEISHLEELIAELEIALRDALGQSRARTAKEQPEEKTPPPDAFGRTPSGVAHVFDRPDKAGLLDGSLHGLHPDEEERRARIAGLHASFDVNRDATIELEEFAGLAQVIEGEGFTPGVAHAIFDRMDKNRDGGVSEEEFVDFVFRKTARLDEPAFHRMIERMLEVSHPMLTKPPTAGGKQDSHAPNIWHDFPSPARRRHDLPGPAGGDSVGEDGGGGGWGELDEPGYISSRGSSRYARHHLKPQEEAEEEEREEKRLSLQLQEQLKEKEAELAALSAQVKHQQQEQQQQLTESQGEVQDLRRELSSQTRDVLEQKERSQVLLEVIQREVGLSNLAALEGNEAASAIEAIFRGAREKAFREGFEAGKKEGLQGEFERQQALVRTKKGAETAEAAPPLRRTDGHTQGDIQDRYGEAVSEELRSPPKELGPASGTSGFDQEEAEAEFAAQTKVAVLTARAQKRWAQIDTDHSGYLDGMEVLGLGEWVWRSFHPNEAPTDEQVEHTAEKILERTDLDGDGRIDQREFLRYYEQTCSAMFRFHKTRAKPSPPAAAPAMEPAVEARSPSQASFSAMDANGDGVLTRDEFHSYRSRNQAPSQARSSVSAEEEAELGRWLLQNSGGATRMVGHRNDRSSGAALSPRDLFERYARGESFHVSPDHGTEGANSAMDFSEWLRFAREFGLHPSPLSVGELRRLFEASLFASMEQEQAGAGSPPNLPVGATMPYGTFLEALGNAVGMARGHAPRGGGGGGGGGALNSELETARLRDAVSSLSPPKETFVEQEEEHPEARSDTSRVMARQRRMGYDPNKVRRELERIDAQEAQRSSSRGRLAPGRTAPASSKTPPRARPSDRSSGTSSPARRRAGSPAAYRSAGERGGQPRGRAEKAETSNHGRPTIAGRAAASRSRSPPARKEDGAARRHGTPPGSRPNGDYLSYITSAAGKKERSATDKAPRTPPLSPSPHSPRRGSDSEVDQEKLENARRFIRRYNSGSTALQSLV